jgi:hypothetical protein
MNGKDKKEFINTFQEYFDMSKKLKKSATIADILLNHELAYVVNPETKEVIWMNDNMIEAFGSQLGKKCHKAFQGLDEPCAFCKYNEMEKAVNRPYVWIHKNLLNKRIYYIVDIYLPHGFNGHTEPCHLEKACDITKFADKILELRND